MSEQEVRIVGLEPMLVASVQGFGESPERLAWGRLMDWAGARGLLAGGAGRRIFGFNNPDPSPGSPNYGYEFWLEVEPGTEPEGEAILKQVPGGLYAVRRCRGVSNIGQGWQRLAAWCEDSPYGMGSHQWLEEHLSPPREIVEDELLLDLYCPIVE
jgi:DNA gyrase inhibitor GyrI